MRILISIIAVLMLASCDDQEKSAAVDAFEVAGVYEAVSADEDSGLEVRTAMINLHDGEYYVARGAASPFVVSEIFHGTAMVEGSRFMSMDLRYFNPQFQFAGDGSIDAILDERTGQISGSMNHFVSPDQVRTVSPRAGGLYTGPPYRLDSVSVVRNRTASEQIQLSTLDGAYVGTLNNDGTLHPVNVSVSNTGALVIALASGCQIEGTAAPTLGASRVQAASNAECSEFPEIEYAGVVGLFGERLIALLVNATRESALVVYFE